MGLADKYPWLCNTVRRDYEPECANSATGNMVSEQEGYNSQGYTTDAYGTFGLKFTYYKVSHSISDEGDSEATEINSDKTTIISMDNRSDNDVEYKLPKKQKLEFDFDFHDFPCL